MSILSLGNDSAPLPHCSVPTVYPLLFIGSADVAREQQAAAAMTPAIRRPTFRKEMVTPVIMIVPSVLRAVSHSLIRACATQIGPLLIDSRDRTNRVNFASLVSGISRGIVDGTQGIATLSLTACRQRPAQETFFSPCRCHAASSNGRIQWLEDPPNPRNHPRGLRHRRGRECGLDQARRRMAA